jgi:hypothetical protein
MSCQHHETTLRKNELGFDRLSSTVQKYREVISRRMLQISSGLTLSKESMHELAIQNMKSELNLQLPVRTNAETF